MNVFMLIVQYILYHTVFLTFVRDDLCLTDLCWPPDKYLAKAECILSSFNENLYDLEIKFPVNYFRKYI